jgi:peptide/nickel transport system substrate-binding protein
MRIPPRLASIGALLVLLAAGCAPTGNSGAQERQASAEGRSAAGPKRLVAVAPAQPLAFNERVARATAAGPYRGGIDLEWLLNSALTVVDDKGVLQPQLAEHAPTTENGLWKVFPDGRMETTWTIRSGTVWHDGTPFTTDDLIFTAAVVRDREIGAFRDTTYDLIDSVEAVDPRTITVKWKSPSISADGMFGHVLATPLPRHLLEKTYLEDKDRLLQSAYWLTGFVGTGPYSLGDFVQGSHLIFRANPQYVLGRPKIDEMEIKIITDPPTQMSNILAGAVDLTLGYGMSLESALELRDRWRDGTVPFAPNGWVMAYVQHINPNPPVVADVRFKRAVMHALDRQEMVETLQFGMAQVADAFLDPVEPDYPAISHRIVRYDYDPRRAVQMIEQLGYTRGPDGFRDATDQRLGVEIRTVTGLDIQVKTTFAVTDYWQRIGIAVEPLVSTPEQSTDREWSATNPSFRLHRSPNTFEELKRYRISQVPTPENRFTGQNNARYVNQELNDSIERYFVTVPKVERNQVLGDIVHHMTDQLVLMGMFYNVLAVATGKRVQNVTPAAVMGSNQTWNAHLWDLR